MSAVDEARALLAMPASRRFRMVVDDAQHALIDAASRLLAALCTELEAARIDAELARRYRAAWEAREALAPAYRASLAKRTPPVDISGDELTPEERAWFDADAAVHGALDDLRRGEL